MPTRRLPQARASPRHTAGAPLAGMPGEIFRSWQLTVATYSAARPARPLPVCAERISGPFGAMGRRWRTLHRPLANGSRPDRSAVASGVTLSRKPATGAPPSLPSPHSRHLRIGGYQSRRNYTFGTVGIAVFAAVGSLRLSRFPSTNLPAGCPLRWRYGMESVFVPPGNRFSITAPTSMRSRRAMRSLFLFLPASLFLFAVLVVAAGTGSNSLRNLLTRFSACLCLRSFVTPSGYPNVVVLT